MKVGDLIRHKYGTLQGSGVVLRPRDSNGRVLAAWTAHGRTTVHAVATMYLEVINESR